MVMSEGNAAMTDTKKGPVDQVVHKVFTPSTVKMNAVRYPDTLTLDPYCLVPGSSHIPHPLSVQYLTLLDLQALYFLFSWNFFSIL